MPVPAGSHNEIALQQILKYIPETTFNSGQIANDGDCTACVVVSQSALTIHGQGPIYDQLLVKGDLKLSGNLELRRLPRLLAVTGDLDLSDCLNLTLMPEAMYVGGSANLSRTPIEKLPARMIVEHTLDVEDCKELSEVNADVSCQSLDAAGCEKLQRIAGDRIYRSLDLSGTAIESLPERLEIDRGLRLKNCRFLSLVPEGTTVRHKVDVRGCSGLFRLPKSLQPCDLKLDNFTVTSTGLHTPCVTTPDAEMMVGRLAGEVIHHHLLENLQIMKTSVLGISNYSSEALGSSSLVSLNTITKQRMRTMNSCQLGRTRRIRR